jgi:FkbM family methyltransferase
MNGLERFVDELDPGLSVRLRSLKMRWRNDAARRFVGAAAETGSVVVDIGANRGVYTHLMSKSVGRLGHVHAVEPVPALNKRLRTIARRRKNVTVHSVALSDRAQVASLHVPVYKGHQLDALATLGPVHGQPSISVDVQSRTLDELLGDEGLPISFLKCDVEGHEHQVFLGALGTFRRHKPVVLVELEQRHRDEPISTTFEFFTSLGYAGYFLTEHGLRDIAEFDIDRDQLAFLSEEFVPYGNPSGYVNDFVVVAPERSMSLDLAAGAAG